MQRLAAGGAVGDVGEQAHEAGDPEGEVGEGHPGLSGGGLLEGGEGEAKDGVVGIALGQSFVEHFGEEAEDGHADWIDGGGERRAEDFELVEADELLAGALGEPGAGDGGGFERTAEALAAPERGFGHAAELAIVAGEEAHDEVRLLDRPGAQDDNLGGEHGHKSSFAPVASRAIRPMKGVRKRCLGWRSPMKVRNSWKSNVEWTG